MSIVKLDQSGREKQENASRPFEDELEPDDDTPEYDSAQLIKLLLVCEFQAPPPPSENLLSMIRKPPSPSPSPSHMAPTLTQYLCLLTCPS